MPTTPASHPVHAAATVEWPSVLLAACIYGGWLLLTACAAILPWWAVMPAGAWLLCWHMSLQHEVIHGHPTPWPRVNAAIGSVPLSLWLPYRRYELSHLDHHRGGNLTDPVDDPESFYVTPERFGRTGRLGRALLAANSTLLGRLLLGPALGIAGFWRAEARALLSGDPGRRRIWGRHALAAAAILLWLAFACHLSPVRYGLLFVYPGYALALLRSFAEHRAAADSEHRTAIVERTPLFGLLFLHNNLHVVHHLRPGLPWYRIPAAYRADRAALLRRNGGLVYRGYREVARRYLLRPHDRLVHEPFRSVPVAPAAAVPAPARVAMREPARG